MRSIPVSPPRTPLWLTMLRVTGSVSGHLGHIVPITTVAVLGQLDRPYCLSQDRAPVCVYVCDHPAERSPSRFVHVSWPCLVMCSCQLSFVLCGHVIIELSCVYADVLVRRGVKVLSLSLTLVNELSMYCWVQFGSSLSD